MPRWRRASNWPAPDRGMQERRGLIGDVPTGPLVRGEGILLIAALCPGTRRQDSSFKRCKIWELGDLRERAVRWGVKVATCSGNVRVHSGRAGRRRGEALTPSRRAGHAGSYLSCPRRVAETPHLVSSIAAVDPAFSGVASSQEGPVCGPFFCRKHSASNCDTAPTIRHYTV